MEGGYCTNDDYQYIAERLKYKFVKKGQYAVRQGSTGDECYFIIQGAAKVVLWGHDNKSYLN